MLPLVAVVGPTASGKTALATALCQQFGGEIVSADAKQVYKGMDIGTAKELDLLVRQHLLDFKQPGERMTVSEYQAKAYECIDALHAQHILPVLTGGSGLYAEAVTRGYLFAGPGEKQAQPRYAVLELAITWDREVLRERVAARTKLWLEQGLLEEIARLREQGVADSWLEACGMEYRYFLRHLRGELSLKEAERLTNTAINQFIKRQYTWWRRHPELHWVTGLEEAKRLTQQFLKSQNWEVEGL